MSIRKVLDEMLEYMNNVQMRATIVEVSLLEKLIKEYGVPEENVRKVYDTVVEVLLKFAKIEFKEVIADLDSVKSSYKNLFNTENLFKKMEEKDDS